MPGDFNDTDYNITIKTKEDEEKKTEEQQDMPDYIATLEITEEQETRLKKEIKEEFEAQKTERDEDDLVNKWDSLDAQFDGELEENVDMQFNLHKPTTKVKCRGIRRLIDKAFDETSPRYNISPRPEFDREGGREVSDKQTDFLDFKIDTQVEIRSEKQKIHHSAIVKGTGIEKVIHVIKRKKRKREETYQGNPEEIKDPQGNVIGLKNEGLGSFVEKYPDAPTKYPGIVKKLEKGEKVSFIVEYTQTLKSDPIPTYVDLKDFYVRKDVNGAEGLKDTLLIGEREQYYWWELEEEERKGNFRNLDELKSQKDSQGNATLDKKYRSKRYSVIKFTYQFKEKEDDDQPIKIICWIEEEKWVLLGEIYYPWSIMDTEYNPHYILHEKTGFYQDGIAQDITDLNIAEDAFLNFGLEGAWMSNMITPITPKNSDIDNQFISKTWMHGMPLNADPKDIGFLQAFMKPTSMSDIIITLQNLSRMADDVSGHSSLQTGKESEIDPRAPAAKTIALLRQSGINIEDYIKNLLPAHNRTAEMMLNIYYDISQDEGQKYKPRPEMVTGDPDLFSNITRDEMAAQTNIQSNALAFDFDKINEKREDIAIFQLLRNEPLFFQNPENIQLLLKTIVKGWSQKWKNVANVIFPPLAQIKQQKISVAFAATAQWLNNKVKESEVSGQKLNLDQDALITFMSQMQSEIATPPSDEIVAEREKAAKEGRPSEV